MFNFKNYEEMRTHILGYPRIGSKRELKKACENYWAGKTTQNELIETGKTLRNQHWTLQKEAGVDLIPCNDFSFYDQVLDLSLALGAIPERYKVLESNELDLYFAMARGYQKDGHDITAMEMTKWFDTNYHYIVPEFYKNQKFKLNSNKILGEYQEAKALGIEAKPVIIGLISYLLLGKEKDENFDKFDLIDDLLPLYTELIGALVAEGVTHIQIDEPFLVLDLEEKWKNIYKKVYQHFKNEFPNVKFILATYFEGLKDNTELAISLPIDILHIDLVRAPEQLNDILENFPKNKSLSLGIVDGRNIWKNNLEKSLEKINAAKEKLGVERIFIASSCSLLHCPSDLDFETKLPSEIKDWLAFSKQKVSEISALKALASESSSQEILDYLEANKKSIESRSTSKLIHDTEVKDRVSKITSEDAKRDNVFSERKKAQKKLLNLPLFPTTTIGSFPQTKEVRSWRAKFKKGEISAEEYDSLLKEETKKSVEWQEEIGIDVLVHGEFERNDMVEYFGEQLKGFTFTQNGWVQSYGSRCVKPPIIFGDVSRPNPMTVYWSKYAQSLTKNWMKGMLTGPVTILQWSFVRDDQPRSETCKQIALAIRDEVKDLEQAGIRIIQIDEPAIREGLPLRKKDWNDYLSWAVESFRLSSSGIEDSTQIHTHMCYSEFNDIIQNIADMDADVITIECSRSQMELLGAFANFKYSNEIGPGVYDIHSPRIPSKEEMLELMKKAEKVIPADQLWVNPDCGLKTRHWDETKKALKIMVEISKALSSQS